jgi:membrane protease YdiL (CAAX protease family)
LLLGTTGLSNLHILVLIGFGFLSAYIYESTGNLWLCIICHGVGNGLRFIGLYIGYLLNW